MEVVRPSASYRADGVTSSIERGARDGVVWHVLFAPQKDRARRRPWRKSRPFSFPWGELTTAPKRRVKRT